MRNTIKVAIFAILAIAIFIFGMNFLKGSGFFDRDVEYYALYDEVNGLYPSDPVVINGYQIGRIQTLSLINEGPDRGKILAAMKIDPDIHIPDDSRAILYSVDFLGEMSVKILTGESEVEYQEGDTISTEIEMGMIAEIGNELTPLTDQIQQTITNVNSLFDEESGETSIPYTVRNVNETLDEFTEAAGELTALIQRQNETIDSLMANLESITANLESNNDAITATIANARDLTDTLKRIDVNSTLETANTALARVDSVVAKLNSGEGSLGALLNEREMYDNLETSTENLDKLLEDLRLNPERYVQFALFGGRNKEKKRRRGNNDDDTNDE